MGGGASMGGRVCARSVGEAAGRCGRGMEIQASIPERNPRTQSKAVGAAVCTTWVTRRALHTHTHTHTHTFSRLAVGYVHCGYLSSSGRSRSEEGGIIREREYRRTPAMHLVLLYYLLFCCCVSGATIHTSIAWDTEGCGRLGRQIFRTRA